MQQEAMCIATILGPFLILQGLWLLFYRDNVVKVWNSIKNTPATLYLISFINLLAGLIIVHMYNVWEADLSIFVTLLGWVVLLRAFIGIFMPQLFMKMFTNKWMIPMGVITLVFGLFLGWFAMGMT